MSAATFWDRITTIAGTDDPNQLTYYTGMSYAQLTRYASGTSGAGGPRAADLARVAATLSRKTHRRVTMGQLWGTEPLETLTGFDLPAAAATIPPGAPTHDQDGSTGRDKRPPGASTEQHGELKRPPVRAKAEKKKGGA